MKKSIVEITALIFIIIFIYTGFSKLLNHRDFIYSIGWWKPLKSVAGFISYFIPGIEIVIAVLLFSDRYKKQALTGSMMLMLLFIAYIVFMKLHESNLPCSCGGIISSLTWNEHLVLNIVLLSLCILSLYLMKRYNGQEKINSHHSEKDWYLPAVDSEG